MSRLMFFGMRLLSVVLVCNGIVSSFAQKDCDESGVAKCTKMLSEVTKNANLAFPENDEDFKLSCRYFTQYIECIENFVDRCYQAEARDAYMSVFSGGISLMTEVCTSGSPYRAKLAKYSPCFRSIEKELRECMDVYSAQGEALSKAKVSEEEKVKKSCCYLNSSTECILAPTRKQCGMEAVDLIQEASMKIQAPLVMVCSAVKYDSSSCPPDSSASSITISGFFGFLLMIFMAVKL